ncbi:MAG TPA: TMEM175 family protein [Gemmatimonadales bacterium]|nr:TMEM175 family protein [Gemmatimonadales bacterium]
MGKTRLEAFSDGVIAILITIMVLELRVPDGASIESLRPSLPVLLSYAMSFVYIGIYWVNHHHLFHATHKVTGGILWANLHLLFWLSLVPFTTRWIGENPHGSVPTASYGVSFLMPGIAWLILQAAIVKSQGDGSVLAKAIGSDFKGKASAVLYAAAIALAFVRPWLSDVLFVVVALMWLVPDRRIERVLEGAAHH